MSRQERADDSVAQICDAIRSMAVQENPRSKLVVSFPLFRGDESEDVFDFLDNFKRAATLVGQTKIWQWVCLCILKAMLALGFNHWET